MEFRTDIWDVYVDTVSFYEFLNCKVLNYIQSYTLRSAFTPIYNITNYRTYIQTYELGLQYKVKPFQLKKNILNNPNMRRIKKSLYIVYITGMAIRTFVFSQ
jgi:hypothetical protein